MRKEEFVSGPICHETLPPKMLSDIKAVFDVVGPFFKMTLEQFEVGFMRDAHPEQEIHLWIKISNALRNYVSSNKLTDDEIKNALGALVSISSGCKDQALLAQLPQQLT